MKEGHQFSNTVDALCRCAGVAMFRANEEGGVWAVYCLTVSPLTGNVVPCGRLLCLCRLRYLSLLGRLINPHASWTRGHTHIQSHNHVQDKHLPPGQTISEHTLIIPCCIYQHVYSLNDRYRDTAQLLTTSSLQSPKSINQPRQSSQSTELSSDIKHLLSSHQHVTLRLSEHHKASRNTDKILNVYVQFAISCMWQLLL